MKYVALLRGINVGGNSIIKMAALKNAFEKMGMENVLTYIQSGNVIFESTDLANIKLSQKIESNLSKTFSYHGRIVLRSLPQFQKILNAVPPDWKKRKDIRCYIAFVREPVSAKDIAQDIKIKDGIDFLKIGDGALYMTTLLEGISKSSFSKLAGQSFYKDITIRNYNTSQKILKMMSQK